jgi:hypothetical protein
MAWQSLSQVQAEAKTARAAAEAAEEAVAAFRKEVGADGSGGSMSAAEQAQTRKDYVRRGRGRARCAPVARGPRTGRERRVCVLVMGPAASAVGMRARPAAAPAQRAGSAREGGLARVAAGEAAQVLADAQAVVHGDARQHWRGARLVQQAADGGDRPRRRRRLRHEQEQLPATLRARSDTCGEAPRSDRFCEAPRSDRFCASLHCCFEVSCQKMVWVRLYRVGKLREAVNNRSPNASTIKGFCNDARDGCAAGGGTPGVGATA